MELHRRLLRLVSMPNSSATVSGQEQSGRGCGGVGGRSPAGTHRVPASLGSGGQMPRAAGLSGLASARQHVLAPGAARPQRSKMLAANQSSDFQNQPPPLPSPHYPSKSQSGSQASARKPWPGGEARTQACARACTTGWDDFISLRTLTGGLVMNS